MSFASLWAVVLLAEQAQPQAQPQARGSGLDLLMPTMLGIMVLFYFMVLRPQRREQDTRQAMLRTLKKNDRVVTHSGLYGIVNNVRAEADEVTLTVDESNSTKVRVTLQSIARRLGDEADGEKAGKS